MNIVIEDTPENGILLRHAAFGTVVRTPRSGDTIYLVASPMDGTGERVLVTLAAGTIKPNADQNMRVIPLDATLIVHGVA